MVAIFTGLGAGFAHGSRTSLGAQGLLGQAALGRANEGVFLNAQTGNLVLTQQDEFLTGVGPDISIGRTYNTETTLNENGDRWRQTTDKRLVLSGAAANTTGSIVTRTLADGSSVVWTWNGSAYVTSDLAGEAQTVSYNGSTQWIWRDNRNHLTEIYKNSDSGYISSIADDDGNALTYTYLSAGKLDKVFSDNGEWVQYLYETSTSDITGVVTHYGSSSTLRRAHYSYDGSHRLTQVTIDLSPEDSSISDGKVFTTTYGYDASGRLNSIRQLNTASGAASLAITYDGSNRVTQLLQSVDGSATRRTDIVYGSGYADITTYTEDYASGSTPHVTTRVSFAVSTSGFIGEMTSVTRPMSDVWQYTYDSQGRVTHATDALNKTTIYTYGTNGNLASVTDPNSNVVSYSYDTNNNLTLETRTGASGSGDASTLYTRYIYDTQNRLRYVISAAKRVTAYDYDTVTGLLSRTSTFPTLGYSTIAAPTMPTLAQMDTWRSSTLTTTDKANAQITDIHYDARGNIDWSQSYSAADASGPLTSGGYKLTTFNHDTGGRLLSRTVGPQNAETFVYDGLGRLILSTDLTGARTSIIFNDANDTTKVITLASSTGAATADSYVSVSQYDKTGNLISRTDTVPGENANATTGTQTLVYDRLGRLRKSTDATGKVQYFLYDANSRKIADVGQNGELVEYRYDLADRLIATVRYAQKLSTGDLGSISGTPIGDWRLGATIARPSTSDTGNIAQWTIYDAGGRIIETIAGDGAATKYEYDASNRLLRTTNFYNKLTVSSYFASPPTTASWPTSDAKDRVTRSFYDGDGYLVGTLSAEGFVSRIVYDNAGRKIEEIACANAPTGTPSTDSFQTILANTTLSSANDRSSRYVYDGQGLLRYEIDALGFVTEYVYRTTDGSHPDQNFAIGLLRQTIRYKTAPSGATSYTLADVASHITTDAADRVSYAVHNLAGQLAYTIDATGSVTAFAYDSAGRISKTTQFATANTTAFSSAGSSTWLATMDTWAAGQASNTNNRISRTYYNVRGDVLYSIDAEGYATGFDYDAERRVTEQHRYPNQLTQTERSTLSGVEGASKGAPITTTTSYDAFGRVASITDGAGAVTQYVYYANGQLQFEVRAAGHADESKTALFYDQAGRKTRESRAYGAAEQTDTYFTYDAFGALATVTDPRGAVTSYTYDKLGRVTKVRTSPNGGTTNYDVNYEYDNFSGVKVTDARGKISYSYLDRLGRVWLTIDAANFATEMAYTSFGEVASTTRFYLATSGATVTTAPTRTADSFDAKAEFVYDKLGRVTLSIDAEDHATKTTYNAFGEIISTKHFANKTTTLAEPTADPANDATTGFVYDRRGLLTSTTDAASFTQSFAYDAYRNRTSMTNALGGVTTYVHNAQGLLIEEHLPSAITTKKASDGSTIAVINKYEYDLRGNLKLKIEAFDAVEQRTTAYAYDKLDRVISKTGDAFHVTASATGATAGATTAPVEHYSYDKSGNLTKKIDAAGAETIYWYDDVNRLTHQVSPLGTLTTYTYDENGNVTETNVYATPVTLPQNPASAPPTGAGSPRTTQSVYDNLNRLIQSKVLHTQTAQYGSGLTVSATGTTQTTTYDYDARGNVVLVTDANGAKTYSYFDLANRKVAQIDGENYRTSWTYDSNNNVVSERRFITQGTAPSGIASAPPGAPSNNDEDRVTTFTYDKMGRRLTETREKVHVHDGSGGRDTLSSTITYSYNGLGEVLTKTEGTGEAITYAYDVIGRMETETRSAFTDHTNTSVTPRASYTYNGLSDITTMRQGAASGATSSDRVTIYTYGAGGRLAEMRQLVDTTTANDIVHTYKYDIAGRVIRDEYVRASAAGVDATEAVGYAYDAEGRVTRQGVVSFVSSAWTRDGTGVDTTALQYDAFGQVTRRGFAHYASGAETVLWTEEFGYNRAGQLERTNSGDGVWKYFMYDGVGNQTLMIASVGTDLNNSSGVDTLGEVLSLWTGGTGTIATTNVAGVVASITKYDKRNQAIEVREPQRQRTASQFDDLLTQRAYNAFGEVAYEINANGKRIDYTYSTMGRLESIRSPDVYATSEAGVASLINPTEWRYYDKAGRLVASRDANGNLTKLTLLAGTGYGGSQALVTQQVNADTGVQITEYDVYGNARTLKDPMWLSSAPTLHKTVQAFDRLGRLVQVDRAGGLSDYYRYDELGQRIKHWNSQLGETKAERIDYDGQGRITRLIAMGGDAIGGQDASTGGDITQYSYAWDASLVTTGLSAAAFGGWTKTTTYANGKTLVEKSDVFDHLVQKVDLGAHTTNITYDRGARVTQRAATHVVSGSTVALGHPLSMSYYNTGRLATTTSTGVSNAWNTPGEYLGGGVWTNGAFITIDSRTQTFTYDKAGLVLTQVITEDGTYDEYGYWIEQDLWWEDPAPVSFTHIYSDQTATYDALGRLVTWSEAGSSGVHHRDRKLAQASRSFEYDANGNVRRASGTYRTVTAQGDNGTTNQTRDHWYRYDGMNRMVLAKGDLAGGAIVRGGGNEIYYNLVGERAYTIDSVEGGATRREDYVYDSAGRLSEVKSGTNLSSAGTKRADFTYDAMGRVTLQRDYDANGTTIVYSRSVTYNEKGQTTQDVVLNKRGVDTYYETTNTYDYGTISGGTYALGAPVTIATANRESPNGSSWSNKPGTLTTNTYVWWDGAMQDETVYDNDTSNGSNTPWESQYNYKALGGSANLVSVGIADGRPRVVRFLSDVMGQVLRRDESDNLSGGDPHEVWYRFSGREMAYVGNNGTLDTDYATSIANRIAATGTGAFFNGASTGTQTFDFDLAHDATTSYTQGSTRGMYIVQAGDTLSSIASALWGDSSLWWKLAEINGLTAESALPEGLPLIIPAGVVGVHNNALTYKPYDPLEVLGNTSPTAPTPANNKKQCGGAGAVIIAVVAAVVVAVIAPYAAGAISALQGGATLGAAHAAGMSVATAVLSGSAALTAGTIAGVSVSGASIVAGGAIAGAASSIVSQGLAVASGIQEKFSWNAVALAAISAAGGAPAPQSFGQAFVRGVANNVQTQVIGVALGLQKEFSWAGVAAAGVGAGVGYKFGKTFGASLEDAMGSTMRRGLTSGASAIANGATRSLIEGSDFGDNVLAALPDVVGQTIGEAIAGGLTGRRSASEPEPVLRGDPGALSGSIPELDAMAAWSKNTQAWLDDLLSEDGSQSYSVSRGDTVEAIARATYGDNWRAGVAAIIGANNLRANANGSPLIYAGSEIVLPSLGGLDVGALSRVGGNIIANNSQRLSLNAQIDAMSTALSVVAFADQVTAQAYGQRMRAPAPMIGANLGQYPVLNFMLGGNVRDSNGMTLYHRGTMLGDGLNFTGVTLATGMALTGLGIAAVELPALMLTNPVTTTSLFEAATGLVPGMEAATTVSALGVVAHRTGVLDDAWDYAAAAACFVAGTLVHTREGLRPIEAIKAGDFVLAQPEFQGEPAYRRVKRTFQREPQSLVGVTVASGSMRETITATLEHPFWVAGSGWTGASDLNEGDVVELASGAEGRVVLLERRIDQQPVFNFAVDGYHTYYVGELGVWVHNTSKIGALWRGPTEPVLIGAYTPSSSLTFGTTRFGQEAHINAARILQEANGGVAFDMRVLLGQQGIDVTVLRPRDIANLGFEFAEIKPLTLSGERTLLRQSYNWNLKPQQIQPITYDAKGNIYFGF